MASSSSSAMPLARKHTRAAPPPPPPPPAFRPLQCYRCRSLLHSPVTLPCGISLCHPCIPIPQSLDFQSQIQCPLPACARSGLHLVHDLAVDVTLQNITSALRAAAASSSSTLANLLSEDHENTREHDQPETLYYGSQADPDPTWDATLEGLFDPYTTPQSTHAASPTNLASLSSRAIDNNILHIIDTIRPKIQQEIECQVCFMVFDRPLTTDCGHTFCSSCLITSLDHNPSCPLCRHPLPLYIHFHNQPPNKALVRFIQFLIDHPPPSLSRDKSDPAAENDGDGATTTTSSFGNNTPTVVEPHELEKTLSMTPLFINSLIFPRMPCYLLVFEPRYRKMLRNVLKTESKLFGMVLPPRLKKHRLEQADWEPSVDTGTLLKVISCELLPDGRALVETVGLSRFQILTYSSMEGYYTATSIELIHDLPEAQELGLEKAALLEVALKLYRSKKAIVDAGPDREPDRQELDLLTSRPSSPKKTTTTTTTIITTTTTTTTTTQSLSVLDLTREMEPLSLGESQDEELGGGGEEEEGSRRGTTRARDGAAAESDRLSLRDLHELDLETLTRAQLMQLLLDFVAHMQTRLGPLATQRLEREFGEMVEDEGTVFSFWIGSILPVKNDLKYELLKERSVRRRLQMVLGWIKDIEAKRSMVVCTIS